MRLSTLLSAFRSLSDERDFDADRLSTHHVGAWQPSDFIPGTPGNDTLTGTAGADTINGGAGADLMKGRGGADRYIVDNVGDVVEEGVGKGKDTVKASVSYTLADNVENLALTGTDFLSGDGNALANRIVGNNNTAGYNVLKGYDGDDTIIGNGGGDIIWGGNGNDSIDGGTGDARLYGEDGDDTIQATEGDGNQEINGGNGNDAIYAGAAASVYGGAGDDTMHVFDARFLDAGDGNDWIEAGGQSISGGQGDDTIDAETNHNGNVSGGGGNDWIHNTGVDHTGPGLMAGGDGNDTLVGGSLDARGEAGNDMFLFQSVDDGVMTITQLIHGQDVIGFDQSSLPVGDGDGVIEGAVLAAAPGGFSSDAELVIRTTPGAIGNATSNYAVGDTAIIVSYDGVFRHIYYFEAQNADAVIDANELEYVGKATSTLATDDFVLV